MGRFKLLLVLKSDSQTRKIDSGGSVTVTKTGGRTSPNGGKGSGRYCGVTSVGSPSGGAVRGSGRYCGVTNSGGGAVRGSAGGNGVRTSSGAGKSNNLYCYLGILY